MYVFYCPSRIDFFICFNQNDQRMFWTPRFPPVEQIQKSKKQRSPLMWTITNHEFVLWLCLSFVQITFCKLLVCHHESLHSLKRTTRKNCHGSSKYKWIINVYEMDGKTWSEMKKKKKTIKARRVRTASFVCILKIGDSLAIKWSNGG